MKHIIKCVAVNELLDVFHCNVEDIFWHSTEYASNGYFHIENEVFSMFLKNELFQIISIDFYSWSIFELYYIYIFHFLIEVVWSLLH